MELLGLVQGYFQFSIALNVIIVHSSSIRATASFVRYQDARLVRKIHNAYNVILQGFGSQGIQIHTVYASPAIVLLGLTLILFVSPLR
jgi:hypothetical protein